MNTQHVVDTLLAHLRVELNTVGERKVKVDTVPADGWNEMVDLMRGEQLDELFDPALFTRQGIVMPFVDDDGSMLVIICPEIFTAYPRDGEYDMFLAVWTLRLKALVVSYDAHLLMSTRLAAANDILREHGLPEELIDYPHY